ncbi:hypothetical protein RRG08_060692 [Elysia crispata]|uniref:Uncharacterized protein n=1 Tax=Elysia crispata TaxID=231223 RepID=A0AAE1D3A3_9GAST|nr:hypothetical protein RRG08_060692 [Elysia crispata]
MLPPHPPRSTGIQNQERTGKKNLIRTFLRVVSVLGDTRCLCQHYSTSFKCALSARLDSKVWTAAYFQRKGSAPKTMMILVFSTSLRCPSRLLFTKLQDSCGQSRVLSEARGSDQSRRWCSRNQVLVTYLGEHFMSSESTCMFQPQQSVADFGGDDLVCRSAFSTRLEKEPEKTGLGAISFVCWP